MTDDTINLLESAIHITKERDKRSLRNALVEIIADYLKFDSVLLVDIPKANHSELLEVTAYVSLDESDTRNYQRPDIEIPYDDSIAKAIEKNEIVSEKNSVFTRTIFPIFVHETPIGILIVSHHHEDPPSFRLVHGFLRIYSNFVAILNDNERDTLTGLLNRKSFDSLIADLLENQPEKPAPLKDSADKRTISADNYHWLAVLDIDHFKSVNDNYGHLFGDEVLMIFANLMSNVFRKQDLLFRYGGEEFVVGLTNVSEENSEMVMERFRKKLEEFDFPQIKKVTVSIGLAKLAPGTHPSVVVEQADQALYYAKRNGRNQTANYHRLLAEGKVTERAIAGEIELF